jgi:hypothetical protein
MYHANLLGGIVARLAGRPVVWSIQHGSFSAEHNGAGTLRVAQLCGRLSTLVPARIVSCSERALATHAALGYGPRRSIVFPNGFDLNRFQPDFEARAAVRAELGLAPDAILIGHIASTHRRTTRRSSLRRPSWRGVVRMPTSCSPESEWSRPTRSSGTAGAGCIRRRIGSTCSASGATSRG